MTSRVVIAAASFMLFGFLADAANAQYTSGTNVRNATRNFLYNRPTVSPYLNLTSRNSTGMSNYHTLVRPQLDQEQVNMQRQAQATRQQQELNQIQSEFRQSQTQNAGMMVTGRMGWSSRGYPRHGIYLNFFPGMNRIGR